MTKEEQQKGNTSGYFMIALGVIGVITRFVGNNGWTTPGIVKLFVSIGILAFGLWTVLKKKN